MKRSYRHSLLAIFIVTSSFLSTVYLNAQEEPRSSDKSGCNDYDNISRYKGAVIQNCSVSDHDKYVLGLAGPVERNFREHGKYFSKFLDVEGKITRIQYLIDKEEGIDKVFENYRTALTGAGYAVLCTAKNDNWPFFNEDYFGGDNPINDIRKFGFYVPSGNKGYYYITAKGMNKASNDLYLSLFISYGSNFGKDFILVTQEIVEVNPVETGLVSAQNIENMLDINGHISIYGIHFETGSYEILPESEPQLQSIADFLNAHKTEKFMIVGHTDNVGNFDANLQLSENRAKAVKNELINKYGVAADQLGDYGVANLAPVTSNDTDQGKARNRRVEIVAR